MGIFPLTAVADYTGSFLSVLTDNIGVVLGILAVTAGINWVLRMTRKSTKGRI